MDAGVTKVKTKRRAMFSSRGVFVLSIGMAGFEPTTS
jgi:hypothetical protein